MPSLAVAIRSINRPPGGWLHIDAIRKAGSGIVLSLGPREGKRGRRVLGWEVSCQRVREIGVSDLDGGGIRLYGSRHPAARQYAARSARLRCRPGLQGSTIL